MQKTTSPPTPTGSAPDGVARYRLGNAALIVGWFAGMALLCYSVAGHEYRWAAMWAVMVPVSIRTVASMARVFRPRPMSDTVAIMEGSMVGSDERQRALSNKAMALAGAVTMGAVSVATMFLTIAAAASKVTIASMDDWLILALAFMWALLLTHNISLIITARYLSRKG